jgi:hypothetical protein
MDPNLARILDYLESTRSRATYGAVGDYLHVIPRAVGERLGRHCPRASWVVNARTGMPTRYFPTEIHPDLKKNDHIITTEKELRELMG